MSDQLDLRCRLGGFLLAATGVLACSNASPAGVSVVAPSVGAVHATIKVRPRVPLTPSSTISIAAARNEFEAFQVVALGGDSGLSGVRMSVSLPGLPAANVRLYREALLNITMPSTLVSQTGLWPDPLIPDLDEIFGEQRNAFPFDVPAGENRAVWIEVLVPQAQAAGVYPGTVHVTAAGGYAADVPFTLEVWGFTLPSTPSLASMFGTGWADICIGHFGAPCDDPGIVASHKQYTLFALDHRVTLGDMVYTGPWPSGSGFDWATWDADYAPIFNGTAATRLAGARMTTIQFQWRVDSLHYGEWARHFRTRGWLDRTFDYSCDEPPAGCPFSYIPGRAATVHQGDPEMRTLVTTTLQQAVAFGVVDAIDILAPGVDLINGNAPDVNHRPDYTSWLAGSPRRQLWWYFSCEPASSCQNGIVYGNGGWPNFIVDGPAIENRIIGWLSYSYDIATLLYFSTTWMYWHGDPWVSVYAYGNNGDGTLFYPGKPSLIGGSHDIPLASLRLKMAREGIEDYEYLKMLSNLGDPALARTLATRVAGKTFQFTEDPTVLYDARREAALRILALSSPGPAPLGSPCTIASACASGRCVDGVCCNTDCGGGNPLDCQACSVQAGAASNGTCSLRSAGAVCRLAAGPCDLVEQCTGTAAACPTDRFAAAGTLCRLAAGPCDVPEQCSGTAAACRPNLFAAAGTVCRLAAGPCDAVERCVGSSASCPPDSSLPGGTACNDGNACTTSDQCQAGVCMGTPIAGCP